MERFFLSTVFTILAVSLRLAAAEGGVLRVPQDYATIQGAIDAALSGDTVLVSRGTYAGGLVISGKTITLASNYINSADPNDISQTIISGGSPIITIQSSAVDTKVQGLTFQSGSYGLVNYAAQLHILNNRFINISSDAVSFESAGGVCRDNHFENSSDDGIDSDHSNADIAIESNTILSSGDDGIEIRLHAYAGPMINIVIRNNYISGCDEDGIQLIDYAGLSSRAFRIERNVIVGNAMVGLGCMPDGNTLENFGGAPLQEEVQLINNTFWGNPYGVTGGDTMLLMNNIFAGSTQTAVKRVSASSLVAYNDFWSNSLDYSDSNVDLATIRFEDPLLDANYNLQAGSPSIDAGAASLIWKGKTVDAPTYLGPAPDLGARETSGSPAPPVVTAMAPDPSAAELGPDPGVFTVSRTGDTGEPLIVSYSLAGTASNGADYEGLTGSVTIAGGASSAIVTVAPVDDALSEGSETVILDLLSDPAYTIGSPNSASVTIADDDLILSTVTIMATDPFAAEAGPDPGTFTVSRTGDTALPLTVDYTIAGDATNGVDFQMLGTSVVIPGGSASATITVVPIDDLVVDDEEVALTIAASPSYVIGAPGGATVTITDNDQVTVLEVRVSSSTDDAEEQTTSTYLSSSDLELTLDGTINQTVGMRFNNVTVPRGAMIAAARVQFKVDETSSTATTLQVAGEDTDNAATFVSATGNISSRTRTSATVPWIPPAWTSVGAAGPAQQTPDIAPVIREIVERPGWASGNSLVIIITGDGLGKRVAEAYNGDVAGAPLLHIEYSTSPLPNQAPTVDAGLDKTVGLPPGTASLNGTASDDGQPGPMTFSWTGTGPGPVSFGDPTALSTTATFSAVGSYTLTLTADDGQLATSDTVAATVVANQAPTVDAEPEQQTITLPSPATLNGTASDDGFPNETLVTTWSKFSGPGTVMFADASVLNTSATFSLPGEYVLQLTANDGALSTSDAITVTANPNPTPVTVEFRVASGSDDAEQNVATGKVSLTSSDLELTTDGTATQIVGIRFTGVTIPRAATIVNAYVQFKVDEATSTAASLVVQAQASDSAPTFATATGNLSSRARTAASVSWVPAAWPTVGAAGTDQRTPNTASVIQEVVNRTGWASGNSLVILITGSGKRVAESYNGDRAGAPLLHVEYR